MARSRKSGRSPRKRTDWVQNVSTYCDWTDNFAITEFDGVVGLPLTIADRNRKLATGHGATTYANAGRDTWSAIPEGNRGTVIAVRGQLQMAPQEPLFGATRGCFAARLSIFEQDAGTLAPIVDPNYGLGVNLGSLGVLDTSAEYANERFLWERKYVWQASQATAEGLNGDRIVDIHWSGRRRLGPNQALFLMVQVGLNSTPFFFSPWLRTLMVVGE